MARLRQMQAQAVGLRKDDALDLPSGNHFKAASSNDPILKQARAMGLRRVAGNIFINHSTKDLWKPRNGKIVRLLGIEVDMGETMQGAPADDPRAFLQSALDDLTF